MIQCSMLVCDNVQQLAVWYVSHPSHRPNHYTEGGSADRFAPCAGGCAQQLQQEPKLQPLNVGRTGLHRLFLDCCEELT